MINIVAAMCVVGDPVYFKFASYSIPSFLRNNNDTDLRVFTDKPKEIEQYLRLSDRLGIVDIKSYFDSHPEDIEKFRSEGRTEEDMLRHKKSYGYMFRDVFPAAMPPMANETLKDNGYTHILKIDSDSYFAGGNMMALVRADIGQCDFADVFLVERRHPLMAQYGGGMPGSGFTLWRIGSRFIPEYIKCFKSSQQVTILNLRQGHGFHIKILARPGYHFVRPFEKAGVTGVEFTKREASQFLPAYFHLHGKTALENVKKLEEWFGENSNVV